MASFFGWIDLTDSDRQKMLDIIHMFQEPDTRDELGIGTIRDAFSDYLFPGTSTIQTRARYMLFIPWIYTQIEQKKVNSGDAANRIRKEEVKLIRSLMNSENEDEEGIIGKREKENLKRMPSNIYWNGLGSWGIRQFNGSQNQYYRSLDNYHKRKKEALKTDDKEPMDDLFRENWDPHLPECPENFLKQDSMDLRMEDACYLRDKIHLHHPNSLLSTLVTMVKEMDNTFFWDLPFIDCFPAKMQIDIEHARNFSEVMHGAALLYNFMLSKESENEEIIEDFQVRLDLWKSKMECRWGSLMEWYDKNDFWTCDALKHAQISPLTSRFVDDWCGIIFKDEDINDITYSNKAFCLISNRETKLKGKRARLTDKRSLENWTGSSGASQLDFRWHTVQTIVNDIVKGLNARGD